MWTYRIKYCKLGQIRFIGHLDTMRAIVRALNRTKLPLAYTQGFNPRPKLSMGPALPLGYESRCELTDFVLAEKHDSSSLCQKLEKMLPKGLDLLELEGVLPTSPKLSDAISMSYMVELPVKERYLNAETLVKEFLIKDSILIERVRKDKRKKVDVRRLVTEAYVATEADSRWLQLEISIGGQGTCSASEVARTIFAIPEDEAKRLNIIRTDLKFSGRLTQVTIDAENKEEKEQKER